jgi:hypothetical protein
VDVVDSETQVGKCFGDKMRTASQGTDFLISVSGAGVSEAFEGAFAATAQGGVDALS